jgi:hypothetical protein
MSKSQMMVRALLTLGAASMVMASATACDLNITAKKDAAPSSSAGTAGPAATGSSKAPAATGKPAVTAPTGGATPACQNRQMHLTLAHTAGAAGTTYDYYVYTNKGSLTCDLYGHPGLRLYGPGEVPVASVKVGRIQPDGQSGDIYAPATHIRVPEGGTAAFVIRYNLTPVGDDATGEPLPCPSVSDYQITVPPSDNWGTSLPVHLSEPRAICTRQVDISSIVPSSVVPKD